MRQSFASRCAFYVKALIESAPVDGEHELFGLRRVAPSGRDGALHGALILRGQREQATWMSPGIVQQRVDGAGTRSLISA